MKSFGFVASIVVGGLSSIGVANADTTAVFDVSGSFVAQEFVPPPLLPLSIPIPLGGTLTIDVTMGSVTAADLTIPTFFAPLNIIDSQHTLPNGTGLLYELKVSDAIGDSGSIDFFYPNDQSDPLIGHSFIYIDQGEFTSHLGPVVFGLTGHIATIPEPAVWTTMLPGLAGICFAAFRRTKRAALATLD